MSQFLCIQLNNNNNMRREKKKRNELLVTHLEFLLVCKFTCELGLFKVTVVIALNSGKCVVISSIYFATGNDEVKYSTTQQIK